MASSSSSSTTSREKRGTGEAGAQALWIRALAGVKLLQSCPARTAVGMLLLLGVCVSVLWISQTRPLMTDSSVRLAVVSSAGTLREQQLPPATQTVDFAPANLPLDQCHPRPAPSVFPFNRPATWPVYSEIYEVYQSSCRRPGFSRIEYLPAGPGEAQHLVMDCPPGGNATVSARPLVSSTNADPDDAEIYTGPLLLSAWRPDVSWIYAHCTMPGQPRQTELHFFCTPNRWLMSASKPGPSSCPDPPSVLPREYPDLDRVSARRRPRPLGPGIARPLIIMLQFDATGRDAFDLSHPHLRSQLNRSFANARSFSMKNLWVNGYNSPPNMKRVHMGDGQGDSVNTTTANLNKGLFHLAKCRGMRTVFMESYFPQYPIIFKEEDVDLQIAGKVFEDYGVNIPQIWNAGGCVGGVWVQRELVQQLWRVIDQFEHHPAGTEAGLFVYFNQCDGHGDDWLRPRIKDWDVANLLHVLDESGVLTRSLVLMFGDHGLHFSHKRDYTPGNDRVFAELYMETEHRNPVLEVVVGNALAAELGGPDGAARVHSALEHNQYALLGHSDTFVTVAELLGSPIAHRQSGRNILLDKVSRGRTCKDANIPLEWCNCWKPR